MATTFSLKNKINQTLDGLDCQMNSVFLLLASFDNIFLLEIFFFSEFIIHTNFKLKEN